MNRFLVFTCTWGKKYTAVTVTVKKQIEEELLFTKFLFLFSMRNV